MSTQQLHFTDQAKLGQADGLAVVFLLLGAPHIYSFLRRRSHQRKSS